MAGEPLLHEVKEKDRFLFNQIFILTIYVFSASVVVIRTVCICPPPVLLNP